MSVGFELVDHTADIGVRVWGPTAEEVFEQAALAMFSLVCDPLDIGELAAVEHPWPHHRDDGRRSVQGRAEGHQVEGARVGLSINQGLFGHGSSVIVSS